MHPAPGSPGGGRPESGSNKPPGEAQQRVHFRLIHKWLKDMVSRPKICPIMDDCEGCTEAHVSCCHVCPFIHTFHTTCFRHEPLFVLLEDVAARFNAASPSAYLGLSNGGTMRQDDLSHQQHEVIADLRPRV